MFTIDSSKCSLPLIAVAGCLVPLLVLLLLHLFLTPLDHFSSTRANNLSFLTDISFVNSDHSDENLQLGIDFDSQPLAYSDREVTYRGAPWKAEIGKWLSRCGAVSTAIDVVENISGKQCKNNCSGRGVCNQELGQCRCFLGFAGEECSKTLLLECNLPYSIEKPYGPWIYSICPAHCDTTRAKCFCGNGTKYPNRAVTDICGFKKLHAGPADRWNTDWTKADFDHIFTSDDSKNGWCNVDPEAAYASTKVKHKEECRCKYDGHVGLFCEIPTECSCPNQCSGHGYCRGGFCQCYSEWYGIDCSVPSTLSAIQEWPMWLRPSTVNLPDKAPSDRDMHIRATVKKKRPLIYVYDLPPEFNSQLIEGRHNGYDCVNRLYNYDNRTYWTGQLYGAQLALYESILASPHRTLNGEEADYFYVPVLDSCIIARADETPYLHIAEHGNLRSSLALDFYKRAYNHIVDQYPYWNRSLGKDHIWFFAWDEGACCAPKEIWKSVMLVHWGNTNSKHNYSTTAYWPDSWDVIPSDKRGNHPCFDPDKDILLPAWKKPDARALLLKMWARPLKERKTLFYFNGNLGPAYDKGRPEDKYSMGIRQKLGEEFGSTPNKEGKLGRQHASNVIVTPIQTPEYHSELSNSIFCGVFPGDGWSGRVEDSILQGCIPVIIQDGILLPYENVLNYKSFAVRIKEDDIPNLIRILQGFNEREIETMLANVRKIWQRFLYRDSILLEAQRQKKLFSTDEDWAVEFSKLEKDDVFSTFIQILHYKLHNDPWRRHAFNGKKFGLPQACLKAAR